MGPNEGGGEACGPCWGIDVDFTCQRCAYPGDIYADGRCTRCVASDRVRDLLSGENGQLVPQLVPLAEALISATSPRSVINWLSRSGCQLLASLAAGQAEITHDLLDDLPQDHDTRAVRNLLITTQVLPSRDEFLARLEIWLRQALEPLPSHHLRIIRPFAEWAIVRDARRRSFRSRYRESSATADRGKIRTAIEFMAWLDASDLALSNLAQSHFDLWLVTASPTRRKAIGAFIRWANGRRLTRQLETPTRPRAQPTVFHDDAEHHDQLLRCLTDQDLPRDVRIAGAFVRLYALPVTRIVHLTTDCFKRDQDGAYITFDKAPVLLPPTLARLIEQQIANPVTRSMLQPAPGSGPAFLFPGPLAHQPRRPQGLAMQLLELGLPTLAAHNTAMIAIAADLPPIVTSDLFGVHVNTAVEWSILAQDNWADHLAARKATQ
ncbi:hypothetical protein [Streptomyces umbrinus]|uniref:hypothetical protein n=1 Tax=Streptomyces umbrinus TaxID=67370 RepID=UPI0033E729ED